MAEITFRSPGVSTREIDLTSPTSAQPVGLPACVISPTEQGPAFVPQTLPTLSDYRVSFGGSVDNLKYGILTATEWFKTQQALTQVRVLGIGDGLQRITTGAPTTGGRGRVNTAGFVVGERQPQSTLSGALGNNAYAVNSGIPGRTYVFGCFMSDSAGSTYLTDAVRSAGTTATPIVRGVILAASGVACTLSSAYATSTVPTSLLDNNAPLGSTTGSVKLSSGLQEFVMLLTGHKGTDPQYPNYMTASFDPSASNYFGNLFNKDPLKLEEAGYVLYSHHDIPNVLAVPTGSGVIVNASGSAGAGGGYESVAFMTVGAATRNSGSATIPNFECFEERYQAASTPWFISQKFGGVAQNLFKIWALSDGEYPNTKFKISIENIAPSNTDTNLYGTFDLIVRDFNDSDGNKIVLEQHRGLSLDPTSNRYIAKVIGDSHTFFNFDTTESAQKLQTNGEFQNRSRYIRVEMADAVTNSDVDGTALPMGFRGIQHLMTSGSAPLPTVSHTNYYSTTAVLKDTVQPPVPLRMNIARGTGASKTADKTLYWGVQFEKVTSATELNASTVINTSLSGYTKFFPTFQLDWMNMVAKDNPGVADTTTNGIIDADRFNNNLFTLENVKIKYNTTTGAADLTNLKDWVYIRQGGVATNVAAATRALAVSDLLNPSVRTVGKFTTLMAGGFNGVRPFNTDTAYLTNNAVVEEMNNTTRGYSSGPTVKSYIKAIDIVKDTSEVDIQLLAIPGIRQRYVTDYAVSAVETDRFDCLYLMDIEEHDTVDALVTAETQDISIKNTANYFKNRGLNSSFVAAYFPDVIVRDNIARSSERVPPSIVVLGAFGNNDALGHPWYAPAGFTRGALESVQQITVPLSQEDRDELYSANINPIASFPGQGPVVWGQKTCYAIQSALERVNVRRLLLSLRREVKKIGNRIMFEPLRAETLASFQAQVTPVLKRVQEQNGVERYKVFIDTTTTTEADIANKTIKGKIFLQPTRSLEFMSIDFVLTSQGASVSG